MHTSVVKLRPENILEIAKDVIRPTAWYCEWNTAGLQKPVMCRTALNSWNAYLQVFCRRAFCLFFATYKVVAPTQHLVYHCQQIKVSRTTYLYLSRID